MTRRQNREKKREGEEGEKRTKETENGNHKETIRSHTEIQKSTRPQDRGAKANVNDLYRLPSAFFFVCISTLSVFDASSTNNSRWTSTLARKETTKRTEGATRRDALTHTRKRSLGRGANEEKW